MNYTTLQSLIADYLHRTDLTDKIPTFISLAESGMFRELEVQSLELTASGVTVGEFASLPVDFDALTKLTLNFAGKEIVLDYQPTSDGTTGDTPSGYTYETGKIRLWGAGTGQAFTLYYKAVMQPLSGGVATNWLLDNASDLYLYASAMEGAKYLRDQGEIGVLAPMVGSLMQSVKSKMERRTIPVAGSLRITPRR